MNWPELILLTAGALVLPISLTMLWWEIRRDSIKLDIEIIYPEPGTLCPSSVVGLLVTNRSLRCVYLDAWGACGCAWVNLPTSEPEDLLEGLETFIESGDSLRVNDIGIEVFNPNIGPPFYSDYLFVSPIGSKNVKKKISKTFIREVVAYFDNREKEAKEKEVVSEYS